jgi:thiopurine S-methyltransferase
MQQDFWHERWNSGRIGFHEPLGDPRLPARWASISAPTPSRVLVTLCGKSVDMMWLASQGHAVVGVELSPVAARAFFAEGGLPFTVEECGAFVAYRSTRSDRDVTILVGDFFALDAERLGEVHAVYDRAATVALPEDLRARYAEHLTRLVPAGAAVLLIALEYEAGCMQAPPFPVTDAAVRALFAPGFAIDLVEEVSGPEVAGRLRDRGLQTMTERAYRLRRHGRP